MPKQQKIKVICYTQELPLLADKVQFRTLRQKAEQIPPAQRQCLQDPGCITGNRCKPALDSQKNFSKKASEMFLTCMNDWQIRTARVYARPGKQPHRPVPQPKTYNHLKMPAKACSLPTQGACFLAPSPPRRDQPERRSASRSGVKSLTRVDRLPFQKSARVLPVFQAHPARTKESESGNSPAKQASTWQKGNLAQTRKTKTRSIPRSSYCPAIQRHPP